MERSSKVHQGWSWQFYVCLCARMRSIHIESVVVACCIICMHVLRCLLWPGPAYAHASGYPFSRLSDALPNVLRSTEQNTTRCTPPTRWKGIVRIPIRSGRPRQPPTAVVTNWGSVWVIIPIFRLTKQSAQYGALLRIPAHLRKTARGH